MITVAFDWVGALGAPAATAAAGLAAVATAAPAAVTDLTIDPTHNCDPDLDPMHSHAQASGSGINKRI